MVGGTIINVVPLSKSVWVQVQGEGPEQFDTCAIRVKHSALSAQLKPGDLLWWQSGKAYWTPKPCDVRSDVPLDRVGYSHSSIPNEVMDAVGREVGEDG